MARRNDMNMNEPQISLDDILDAYLTASEHPDPDVLQEWITRYPHYTQELTDFTVHWSLMETLPPVLQQPVDDETLILRGMSVVQNLLHAQQISADHHDPPISSLVDYGKAKGLTIVTFADKTDLSVPLVSKLDRRLIRYKSIPQDVFAVIATILDCGVNAVQQYLQGIPKFTAGTKHHAKQAPTLAEPEDFFAAVRQDLILSDESRARWLALDPGTTKHQ